MPLTPGVGITGKIVPKYTVDTYPVIDPIYGIDSWRSVADHTARNAITASLRRQGMAVWTRSDGKLWTLDASPWNMTDADWTEFSGGIGPGTVISVDNGGTGVTTLTGHAVLVGRDAADVATVGPGSSGQILTGQGVADPAFVTVSGDGTFDASGNLTVTGVGGILFGTMATQDADDVSITGGTITGLPTPTNGSDAATKSYTDSLATGFSPRDAVVVATTANLTATYANGTAGVGATLTNSGTLAALAIDGVTLSVAARVLVKDQSAASRNGIYTVTTAGSGAVAWVLTRATDYDSASEVAGGTYTVVSAGSTNAGSLWVEGNAGPFVIGTTAIVWVSMDVGSVASTFTGDVTGTGTGTIALTIANNAVTNAKMATSTANRLAGYDGSGNFATVAIGSGLSLSGGTLSVSAAGTVTSASVVTANGVSATVATATTTPAFTFTLGAITPTTVAASGTVSGSNLSGTNTGDQTITLTGAVSGSGTGSFATTLASIATHTVLANLTGGSAAPTAATPTQVFDLIGAVQGDVLYRGASAWSVLAPGTSGQFLKTQGAAANPAWSDIPSVTSNPSVFQWQLAYGTDAEVVADPTEWQICTFSGTFSKVDIAAKTAPTGAAFIIDILLSSDDGATWVSLWATTPANRPSLAIGSKRGSQTSFDTSAFTADDLIRIDIIQVGSTVPGKNIRVVLVA